MRKGASLQQMIPAAHIVELLQRVRGGDAAAVEALVRAFLRPAYVTALAILGRPEDAEDAAQDAVLTAVERLDSCREDTKFGAWLLQIVRNTAKNRLLQRKRREGTGAPRAGAAMEGIDAGIAETRRDLLAALQILSPIQREIVLLHDLEGWTHREIAEAVGISEVTARQHLFLARHVLRSALDRVPEERMVP